MDVGRRGDSTRNTGKTVEWGLNRSPCVARAWRLDPIARLLKTSPLPLLRDSRRHTPHLPILSSSHLPPVTIMSQPSVAKFVMKRSWLNSWMKPLANWYTNVAGYRQLGLRYAYFSAANGYSGLFLGRLEDFWALGNGFLTSRCPQGR